MHASRVALLDSGLCDAQPLQPRPADDCARGISSGCIQLREERL